ncbi:MAG: amino acid adenylation domain-containing protein, partial [Proteobacteria bacterium]|nr:amino acid adenylation domain-containing protein [Pseudomonadota bacterium]
TALFDGSTILRLIRHFKVLLNEIIKNPGQQIGNIPILTFEETQQILLDWNNTKTPYSPSECVYTLFENQVNQTPDAVAVVFENQTLSYQDLNQRANKLAHHLIRSGVGPEVLVGLYVERSLEMIVGLLGIMKAGGAYVPLDPKYHPKHRLAMMLEDAGVSLVLTQDKLVKNIPDTPHVVCLDRDWESIEQEKSSDPKTVVAAKNLVYVIYTSGSTGTPKGVAIEHCQLFNYLSGMNKQLGLPRGASYATVSTIAADLGNTVIFSSLCTGGQLHVISQERAIDSKGMADYFEYYSIDCLKIVPSHIEALQTGNSRTVLPQKLLILGGEASHSNWVKQLQKMAPECSILNHYGPTEATIGVLTHQVSNKPHNGIPAILPLGRPIANTRIYILDRNLNPVPVGVSGELCIGGETLARGYLNRPDLTAEKFIPDPFSSEPGARIYKTGDLARYLQDGTIAFLGRIDFQIKIRGFRIEPGEIESVLSSHPEVKAVVVAVLDNSSNNKKLAAYIVSNSDKPVSDKKLRVFLRNHLPDYMIPSAFVQIETMPLNPNGKVDRHFLIEHYKPQMAVENKTGAPKTGTEKTIAGIWKQIMGLVTVGRHDNFFSVGGHSLNALQLANRLREKFHVDMSVSETYETKTIAELAKKIEGMQNKDTEPSTKNNNTSERLTGKFSRGFMGKLFKKVGFRSKQKA